VRYYFPTKEAANNAQQWLDRREHLKHAVEDRFDSIMNCGTIEGYTYEEIYDALAEVFKETPKTLEGVAHVHTDRP
jgi:hypothetical protein